MIKDGSTAWSVECPMSAPPAAGAGFVYAGSDGLVEARAEADGRAAWRRPVPGRVTSLHWDAGWLFAQTEQGPFLSIRAVDGEILWQKDFGSPLSAPPAAAGDRVYLPLKDGRVVALTLQTGDGNLDPQACRVGRRHPPGRRSRLHRRPGQSVLFAQRRRRRRRLALAHRRRSCSACRCSTPSGCISSRSTTSCAGTIATTDR